MATKEIRFIDQTGASRVIEATTLLKKLGVGSVIRIPQAEYPYNAQPGQKVWHINLPIYDGYLGEWVLLAEIIENGFKNQSQEEPPLLSFAHAFLARTTFYLNAAPQSAFQQKWLHSTIGIKSSTQIPEIIYQRYRNVRGISAADAAATAIAIRQFKIRQSLGKNVFTALR